MSTVVRCGDRALDLAQPRVMGILNVTPDSFSDGGQFLDQDAAVQQVAVMLDAGADCIDVGGESTRPGAAEVSEHEELDRVLPVIEAIARRFDTLVSIDSSKAVVMREAARAGAHLINDVQALGGEGCLEAALDTGLGVCLMHMQGNPRSMQRSPHYDDVVSDVLGFLDQRRQRCLDAGIAQDRLLIDPGFGFGKTLEHNLALFASIERFVDLAPVLVGVSRKRMIGDLLGDATCDRMAGSVVAAVLATARGARVVRVHDVAATVQGLRTWSGLQH